MSFKFPRDQWVNSVDPRRCSNFKSVTSWYLWIKFMSTAYEISHRWMPQNTFDDKSPLVQVMACFHQAASHYLSQCWPRSISPCGIIRPQGVKETKANLVDVWYNKNVIITTKHCLQFYFLKYWLNSHSLIPISWKKILHIWAPFRYKIPTGRLGILPLRSVFSRRRHHLRHRLLSPPGLWRAPRCQSLIPVRCRVPYCEFNIILSS